MDSVEETYLIQKTVDAFSGRTLQDPACTSESIAVTAPRPPSIVSPNDSIDDQKDDVVDADTSGSIDNNSFHRSRHSSTGKEGDIGASSSSMGADYFVVDHQAAPSPLRPTLQRTPARRRFGNLNRNVTFAREWQSDEEARAMYGCPSAAREEGEEEEKANSKSSRKQMLGRETIRLPRASLLNNHHHWDSISRLAVSVIEDEDGNQIREEQAATTPPKKGSNLIKKAANKSIEPFTQFIRKFGSNGEEVSERGSFIRTDGDNSTPEETRLLGDSSAEKTRVYSAPTPSTGTGLGMKYPLSPVDSVGDLEDGLDE
jgi:hypothetical protein